MDIIKKCIQVNKTKLAGLEWDIVLSEDASDKIIREQGGNHTRAMVQAREQFTDEISRLKEFWKTPDKSNGLSFIDWITMATEELLVIDALAIYPLQTVGGDLHSLQILDGTTIKPLINDYGMRPEPPFAAYQQILYGFPRSEFSTAKDPRAVADYETSELIYLMRNPSTTSVYGESPTEQSLALADIYLRRQQWVRMEFTEGVVPEMLFLADTKFTPDQIMQYEAIFNNQLAGQTSARMRMKIIPAGLIPSPQEGYGEKFKDLMDEFYSIAICGHFQVQPSEIGLTQQAGLGGGAGVQKGQAQSSEVIGLVPLAKWFAEKLTRIQQQYLNAPAELEFKFMNSTREDIESVARARDIELKNGGSTINEDRAEAGKPLINSPEADKPIFVVGNGAYTLGEDGWQPLTPFVDYGITDSGNSFNEPSSKDTNEQNTIVEETDAEKANNELKRFIRWLKKSPTRPFNFEFVPAGYAEVMNKFVGIKDYEQAEWLAESYLP